MKMFIVVLSLLALNAVSAFAAESTPLPAPLELATSSSACSTVTVSLAPSDQKDELPSWLTSDPLLWSKAVATGCATYCRDNCDGCCAFPAPGVCACC